MNTRVTALSVRFFVSEVASHVSIHFATSSVEPVCLTAEVNIVEEEQNMW